jgi:hypothetical protein
MDKTVISNSELIFYFKKDQIKYSI